MGWTAPDGIDCARMRSLQISDNGDRPWNRLAELAWTLRSGRQFAAWIGLTPKDHSTAGKVRLGGITRAGDEALRSVLVVGATSVIQHVRRGGRGSPWIVNLLKRKPPKLAAVALANKMARVAWKLMVTGERYAAKSVPAALANAT